MPFRRLSGLRYGNRCAGVPANNPELRRFRRRSPRDRESEEAPAPQRVMPVAVKPKPVPVAAPVIVQRVPYLETCAIVRDEQHLPEWVAYQFAIGADHVHLIDNESVVPVAERLKEWVKAGKVSVAFRAGRKKQNRAYSVYSREAKARWVAFIDADEFILPHKTNDLKELLEGYEAFGGVGIPWAVFGSSGHVAAPAGLVIENYLMKGPWEFNMNKDPMPQYKSVVQPARVRGCGNPHYFRYREGWFAVGTQGHRLKSQHWGDAPDDLAQINHYMMKSLEDFRLKQERRGGMNNRPRREGEFERVDRHCNAIFDDRILRFVPLVKRLLENYGHQSGPQLAALEANVSA